jgi:hypothetical protein
LPQAARCAYGTPISKRSVHTIVNAARRSDGAEKVPAHRSQEKANAFSASTNDRERWDERFVCPEKRPATAIWDFFSTVRSACATVFFHSRGPVEDDGNGRGLSLAGLGICGHQAALPVRRTS